MAVNLTQMGGGQLGRRPVGNNQVTQFVYAQIMTQQVATAGWHSSVPPNVRVGNAMNIITNSFLAVPGADMNSVINGGITFERDAYTSSPDKATYEARIKARVNELFQKRQANEQNIQNSLSHASAQNQAQMMMNQNMQMRGMGQPMPQGFPALQQQMQTSPVNQTGQPNLGVNNPNSLPMNPNQPMMQIGAQMRPQMAMQSVMANLPPQDRVKAHQLALAKVNTLSEPNRAQYRAMIQQKFGPQAIAQLQQENIDPLLYFFQTQCAAQMLQSAAKGQASVNQMGMPMQAHQQRPTNQSAQQLPTGPNGEYGGPFANVESIISQQKAGLMAQEAGQMVVPASSGAGRNATPQPIGSMAGPNQGAGQPTLPHQLPQHFNHQPAQQMKMDQRAAQTQAQIRAQAQAKQMSGQPGGLNGPGGVSQSPGMNTLNAPVRRTPMGVGQMEGHPQLGQGNVPFGQQRMDPRFNQPGQRAQMGPNGNMTRNQMLNSILAQMPADTQQQIMSLPQDKIPETILRWNAARGAGPIAGRPQQIGPVNPIPQAMHQFPTGNNGLGQHPNLNMQINQQISQQNQLMMQQMNKLRNPNMPQTSLDRQALMDNMNIPPRILEQLRTSMPQAVVSPDIKKWGQLKQWMEQKNLPPGIIQQLLNFQAAQFQNQLKNQAAAGLATAGSQPSQPNLPQQGMHLNGQPNPQMVQPTPGMAGPNMGATISPQELQNAKNHERFKGWPDDRIRQVLLNYKLQAMRKATNQMPNPSAQAPQVAQQGQTTQTPSQSANISAAQQRQQNVGPETSTVSPAVQGRNIKQPQNRATPNVSAISATKTGIKRPMPDDTTEIPNTSSAPTPRPHTQQPQPGTSSAPQVPQFSPEQLAAMSPEQRQKYEAIVKSRQSGLPAPMSDVMTRLKAIGQEQHQAALKEQYPDIPMTPEQYRDMAQKIQTLGVEINKISKILGRWYALTHNDECAKLFFKLRMRLVKQYVDGDKMTQVRDRFSITTADLDNIRTMLESMARDVAAHYPHGMRKNLSQQNAPEAAPQGVSTQQSVPTTQPAPLNAANLEKQTQALNRIHQRNNSRAGQAPAAPTTAQPPFPFGAQSPDGQPTYAGKPAVTQDNLQLPARKKVKTEPRAGAGPSQSGSVANASPQVPKLPSPEMIKRQAPAEAKQAQKFFCPDPYCDSRNIGFTTEETLRKHTEEEHVKPAEDPMKFAIDGLAEIFGVDETGKLKKTPSTSNNIQSPGDTSKLTQAPTVKAEPANSREAPMKRQGSTAGSKPNELIKAIAGKTGTPKPDSLLGTAPGVTTQAVGGEVMANTIDPQELLSGVTGLEMGGGGAILDMNVYRALTPNDTPESSKDSASSEPNSDVSEGVALNVTLDMGFGSWDPFGFGLDPSANVEFGNPDNLSGMAYHGFAWEDHEPDFDKPFALDTTFFSLDVSQ
ncbi:hypothetical protein O1611_g4692 [Lasiodiplodia mahajangana]|uniref:Uncharacterized protein n=1 Tax=Lasiodiplodia mahajangana TaxID=1108764 RepID=A0ACC2JN92_9PEZI|nr:hypothetical protein O1611_g4692 [Lasiodiplodia mahajangana]